MTDIEVLQKMDLHELILNRCEIAASADMMQRQFDDLRNQRDKERELVKAIDRIIIERLETEHNNWDD